MAFQACPGIAEVVLRSTLNSQECVNVVHYNNNHGSAWIAADLQSLADHVKTQATSGSGICGSLSTSLTMGKVTARDLTSEGALEAISTVADHAGFATGNPLDNSIAACVTLSTGHSGKSFRGRIYLPGVPASAVGTPDQNHINSANATSFATATNFTFTPAALVDWTWCVLSRFHDKVKRTTGIGTDIISVTCNTRLDNQRRRMPRV